ncbi:MAG: S9 family peptidase [Sphingomonadaceae bacterium]|nr:S9 family peptidase [Sphingomonadaceae bacterium]
MAIAQTEETMPVASLAYPETRRGDIVEEQFGVSVSDPYRWLENDVRNDAEVRAWVTAQNAVTDAYLATLPGRAAIEARLSQLYAYERFGIPEAQGGRYFYQRNEGLQNQSPLYVREGLDGAPRLLLDPNSWSEDGATALAEWEASPDGARLAYAIQDGGTDWRTIRVVDVASGQVLEDAVEWVKFSDLDWAQNGSGFFYSRFPEPSGEAEFQALNTNQAVYFHAIGTPQSADVLVYSTPDRPNLNHSAEVTDDGKWLLVTTSEGTDSRYELTIIALTSPRMERRTIVRGLENNWELAGAVGDTFYFMTNLDAPRQRIVSMNVASSARPITELVAQDEATLQGVSLVGDRLIAAYLGHATSEARVFDLSGRPLGTVELPGIGTAAGFGGEAGDPETFFSFTSFATPTAIYRYDVSTGETTPFALPQVAFDPADYNVEQRFYASNDGTRIPLFLVGRTDLPSGPRPALLYGYGGFDVSVTPAFSPAVLQWMEMGGVYAVANLRGGGEYGREWHDAGRLENKQNVFDDFIAAAEYLIAQGVTTPGQLAINGRSNGGLLVGAVVNQRPELFAAALPAVGVMDMLRFDRFTAGRYWVDDYGHPDREADFRTLFAYSPYHNIPATGDYPAILITTADTDDRVVPGHSFKYAAAIQHAQLGDEPRLIRIETRAGHGSGRPTDQIIEEYADLWAFIAAETGLEAPAGGGE